jgi:alpha-2-macroglobulin
MVSDGFGDCSVRAKNIARATTPGTFIVPPAKAEEMYSPEVFGRSGSDWVVVK